MSTNNPFKVGDRVIRKAENGHSDDWAGIVDGNTYTISAVDDDWVGVNGQTSGSDPVPFSPDNFVLAEPEQQAEPSEDEIAALQPIHPMNLHDGQVVIFDGVRRRVEWANVIGDRAHGYEYTADGWVPVSAAAAYDGNPAITVNMTPLPVVEDEGWHTAPADMLKPIGMAAAATLLGLEIRVQTRPKPVTE